MGKYVLYDDMAMTLRSNWYLKQTRDMLLHSGEQLPSMASFKYFIADSYKFRICCHVNYIL